MEGRRARSLVAREHEISYRDFGRLSPEPARDVHAATDPVFLNSHSLSRFLDYVVLEDSRRVRPGHLAAR